MKFKDNMFYKAYDFQRQNSFEPEAIEQVESNRISIYKLDVGLCLLLDKLIKYATLYTGKTHVYAYLKDGSIEGEAWEVLDGLRDIDIKDVESISIIPNPIEETESCTRELRRIYKHKFDFENNVIKFSEDYV